MILLLFTMLLEYLLFTFCLNCYTCIKKNEIDKDEHDKQEFVSRKLFGRELQEVLFNSIFLTFIISTKKLSNSRMKSKRTHEIILPYLSSKFVECCIFYAIFSIFFKCIRQVSKSQRLKNLDSLKTDK